MAKKPETFLEAQQALHEAWLALGKAIVEEFGLLKVYRWLVKKLG